MMRALIRIALMPVPGVLGACSTADMPLEGPSYQECVHIITGEAFRFHVENARQIAGPALELIDDDGWRRVIDQRTHADWKCRVLEP